MTSSLILFLARSFQLFGQEEEERKENEKNLYAGIWTRFGNLYKLGEPAKDSEDKGWRDSLGRQNKQASPASCWTWPESIIGLSKDENKGIAWTKIHKHRNSSLRISFYFTGQIICDKGRIALIRYSLSYNAQCILRRGGKFPNLDRSSNIELCQFEIMLLIAMFGSSLWSWAKIIGESSLSCFPISEQSAHSTSLVYCIATSNPLSLLTDDDEKRPHRTLEP